MRARGRSSFYQSRHHGYPRGWNVAAPSAPLNSGAKHRMRSSPCTHGPPQTPAGKVQCPIGRPRPHL